MTCTTSTFETHAFPTRRATVEVSATALVATVLAMALWTATDRPTALAVAAYVGAMVWLVTLGSMLLAVKVGQRGMMRMVWASFAANAVRVVLCLAGSLLLITKRQLPADAVLISLVIVYLPVLFLETGRVGHHLWHMDDSAATGIAAQDG